MGNQGVLITHSRPPMRYEVAKWEKKGFVVYYQPLLKIMHLPVEILPEGTQAIILSSANAAESLQNSDWDRKIPVYGVGVATVTAAKLTGFKDCSAPNSKPYPSALHLIDWIRQNLHADDGLIVHGSGEILRYDIAEMLKNYGFHTRRIVLYKTQKTEIDEKIKVALRQGAIQSVVISSQQAIEIFVNFCENAGINCQKIRLIVPSVYLKRIAERHGLNA